jgi:ADP-heptose:LPS heptosyltransferase
MSAGVHSVRESAALLSQCALFVGNDTGTLHLAASAGIKCVGIYSAQDWPGRWFPYGSGHEIIREAVPCEGCRLEVCSQNLECLTAITTQRVVAAVERILSQRSYRTSDLALT